jgi:hypothetical protein
MKQPPKSLDTFRRHVDATQDRGPLTVATVLLVRTSVVTALRASAGDVTMAVATPRVTVRAATARVVTTRVAATTVVTVAVDPRHVATMRVPSTRLATLDRALLSVGRTKTASTAPPATTVRADHPAVTPRPPRVS